MTKKSVYMNLWKSQIGLGGKLSVFICCLFPSRAVQHILLYFEALNRCEIILKIQFYSV